jgi:hypothetical protein
MWLAMGLNGKFFSIPHIIQTELRKLPQLYAEDLGFV